MKLPEKINHYHRRSIRLPGYDYATAGAYFVTICIEKRRELLGRVVAGELCLNNSGQMVEVAWQELPKQYTGVETDAFVVMPNHIHGIVILTRVAQHGLLPSQPAYGLGLPDVVQRFKSFATAHYRHAVIDQGWEPFRGRLWQRNYYEHIVRDEAELNRLREYIFYNPANWSEDEENTTRLS
jgi:REP element-mobilizing transposase RayT